MLFLYYFLLVGFDLPLNLSLQPIYLRSLTFPVSLSEINEVLVLVFCVGHSHGELLVNGIKRRVVILGLRALQSVLELLHHRLLGGRSKGYPPSWRFLGGLSFDDLNCHAVPDAASKLI